jgi:hypothetical protein
MLASTTSSFGHATTGIPYDNFFFVSQNQKQTLCLSRSSDQKNLLKYLLTIKNKLSQPRVKYQVHFLFYLIFLNLLSYMVLFVKPPIIKINEGMELLIENTTCSENHIVCSSLNFSKQPYSILQTIVNLWVFMFALEEFRQVKKSRNLTQHFFLFFKRQSYLKQKKLVLYKHLGFILVNHGINLIFSVF